MVNTNLFQISKKQIIKIREDLIVIKNSFSWPFKRFTIKISMNQRG